MLNFLPQLLVNNKIISLDLSVAEVYKKVWCPTNEVWLLYDEMWNSFSLFAPVRYEANCQFTFEGGANENHLSNERAAGRCHRGIHRVTGLNHRLACLSIY